jgi:hypothetical protein
MPEPTSDGELAPVLGLLDHALKACSAYNRPDLGARLTAVRQKTADPAVRVLVVGEFKQGKSSLVNGLIGTPACPVDDDIATSVPTAIRYADEPVAFAHHAANGADEPAPPVEIDPERVADLVCERRGGGEDTTGLRLVELGLPVPLLASGLQLVDTPGVGGLGSRHSTLTLSALPSADAVLLVSDASQEYTAAEMRFLDDAAALCPRVYAAITKIDVYPEWRKVVDLDCEHLTRLGFPLDVFPVSSALREEAIQRGDRGLNDESGYPTLRQWLLDEVVGGASKAAAANAASHVLHVCGQLEAEFLAERDALSDPEAASRVRDELEEARARAERLRQESARWQITLNDGTADLGSDIDHDFRTRTRGLIAEAEARLEEGDPADYWDECQKWFEERVTEEIGQNFRLLHQRANELVEEVASLFAAAESDVSVDVSIELPFESLAQIAGPALELGTVTGFKGKAGKAAAKGFSAIRGSYGGYMMFTMIGGMVGLAAMSPAVLGLTAIMGRKTLRDEKQRELNQRRQQAKGAIRKYVDEVSFEIGKESRDTLRALQRTLRDGFTARAEEIQTSMTAAIKRAEEAAASTGDPEARLRDVAAELERIGGLAERARAYTDGIPAGRAEAEAGA